MCLEIYESDPAYFFTAPRFAWKASLKKAKVKLDLLTDTDMLLMTGKGIKDGICHAIHQYMKPNNQYMKDFGKNKVSSYLKFWNVNNLCGWVMSQNIACRWF